MPTELKGVVEMRKALRSFNPDLNKALNKELAYYLKPITRRAKGFIPNDPLSGWTAPQKGRWPQFIASEIKRGIGYKTSMGKPNKNGFRSLAEIYNKTRAGAIYETAGRKNPQGRNKSGAYFIARMESIEPMAGTDKLRGRSIFKAYKQDAGQAQGAVVKAIRLARDKFYGKVR